MPRQMNTKTENVPNEEWLQTSAHERFCIRIPATLTNGVYSVTEIIAGPGQSTPVHIHQNEDEYVHILEGTGRILYGEKTFDAPSGTIVSLSRGIAHALGNATEVPLHMVITLTPGGCEEALRQIAIAGENTDILAISTQFGVSLVGPPLLG